MQSWIPFLLAESGLPGPRSNLELAQAVADEGNTVIFHQLLAYGPESAPTNTPGEFLAVCGAVGLGKLLTEGQYTYFTELRQLASDPRWRVREGVAMALQRLGDLDMDRLIAEMEVWARGSWFEQRAAAAALCEPRLLASGDKAMQVLQLLDEITTAIRNSKVRDGDGFQALRKGLGYCWSVAVVACPNFGMQFMEKWFILNDPDIRWIMKLNLKKDRLSRMDAAWVEKWRNAMSMDDDREIIGQS